MKIRSALPEDVDGISKVHEESVRTLCAKDYSPEAISAWSRNRSRSDIFKKAIERDRVFVLEENGRIYGYGHLALISDNLAEIHGLYLHPDSSGKGFGKKLLMKLLALAQEHSVQKITLYSTTTAKPFYQAQGFYQYASDDEISIGGFPIACHPMELLLRT
jgi:putative acetyltransferase